MAKYTFSQAVKNEQIALNVKGAGLKTDGLLGPLTLAARTKYAAPAAPTNVKTEAPVKDLSSLPSPDAPTSNLGNLRSALNLALTESAQQTLKIESDNFLD